MTQQADEIAGRLRVVRRELFGEHGGPLLAAKLGIPFRVWVDYESGVSVPGDVLLRFLVLTGTCPHWLLTGEHP